MILTGAVNPTEATTILRPSGGVRPPVYAPPPVYYEEPPPNRRALWPWLLALVLLAGAGIAGWYVYNQVQDQLSTSKPIAVPDVRGITSVGAAAASAVPVRIAVAASSVSRLTPEPFVIRARSASISCALW